MYFELKCPTCQRDEVFALEPGGWRCPRCRRVTWPKRLDALEEEMP